MIIKEERIGGQRLILGDCLEVMPMLGKVDAVVTDPPYGIGSRMGGGSWSYKDEMSSWDGVANQDWIDAILTLSVPSIIWGGNYFDVPPSRRWLIWKKPFFPSMADFEMAFCNFDGNCKAWEGARGGKYKQHPTQKPVALMKWCLGFLPNATTILDPFMGSGTTLVACEKLGRQGIGIELDPDYFEIACKRVDEATRQPDMFVTSPVAPTQEGFDL